MRILIVDDENEARILLTRILEKLEHEVVSAANGAEAWDILQNEQIHLVISDWIMPRMDGLELCRRIRATKLERYIYVIMLTAKNNKNEIIEGMTAGADDFIVKPFDISELDVRIRAGERILRLEKELAERNEKLGEAYHRISKDLEAAAKMQRSLLPASAKTVFGLSFDWIFCPSSFLAGDIFNFFEFGNNHVVFYLLDVAGHGIPAAMLSVTLSKMLSSVVSQHGFPSRSITDAERFEINNPEKLVGELNRRFQSADAMQYFTMVYGVVDVRDGKTKLVQAGHPCPIYQQREGEVKLIGSGGFPIGMLPDIEYEEHEFYLYQGDRLFVYSDGITECPNANSDRFSTERLIGLLKEWKSIPLKELIKGIEQKLSFWKGDNMFEDDITLLGIERV